MPSTRPLDTPQSSAARAPTWLRCAVALAGIVAAAAGQEPAPSEQQAPAQTPPPERGPAAAPPKGRLRAVRIVRNDIFDEAAARDRPLAAIVNALHATTKEHVIARELWFHPGDLVDASMAAEFERNLRALGLFAEARVELVPTGTDGEYDLVVTTRDRLTLGFGAGATFVGGVSGVRGSIGEGNLFGDGNRISAGYAGNSEDEYRGSFSYTDLHVLDTWHTGTIRLARTEDGDSYGATLQRPFKHLLDPRGYTVAVDHVETALDYYRFGETVASVPDSRNVLAADLTWATGDRFARRRIGFALEAEQHDYDPATGPLAPEFRVPGDTSSVFFGPTARWQEIAEFRKVEGLDTLGFIQDLRLGIELGMTAGARYRDEQDADADLQPELTAFAGWSHEPMRDVFTNLLGRASARWSGGDPVGWQLSTAGRLFAMLDESSTLALGVTFDAVEETQDLPIELSLGEDNGLRGYRARLFAGTRRLRTNLEHRLDTGIELLTFRLGLVGFVDAGWVGREADLGRPFTSAGAGLRVGSQRLLGSNVLRIDVARPLDDVPGESGNWSVSVTLGQVFTFGGAASDLGAR